MKARTLNLLSILYACMLLVATPSFPGKFTPPDQDGDGLFDLCEEQIFGTNETNTDTDEDGIPDIDEDHDEDGLTNLEEQNNIADLEAAISEGDIECVKKLIDYYPYIPTVRPWRQTALILAAVSGHPEVVRILLQAGADVNTKITSGMSALEWAAARGNPEVVELLIQNGADVNAGNVFGETALMYAAKGGHTENTQILLQSGAYVNTKDQWSGSTAIIWAAESGNPELVRLLIQNGADVNVQTKGGSKSEYFGSYVVEPGRTALMAAASSGQLETVKLLIAADVDVNARDGNGKSALMHARENEHWDIIDLLIEAGAQEF